MFSRPLALALLAAACVTAAVGGAYVASRQSDAAPSNLAPVEPVATAVHETEAVVTPAEPLEIEAPADPPTPAAAKAAPASGSRPREAGSARPDRRAVPPRPRADSGQREPSVRHVETSTDRQAPASRPRGELEATADAGAARVPPPDAAPPATSPADEGAASRSALEGVEAPAAPVRSYLELVVPSSSVLGLQIQTPLSSERARIEDRVEARVLRDVLVDGRTAIPQGSRVVGAVTLVERGGKVRERARLGVRFHTLVLADGTELPLRTDSILREGDSPVGESARKIGGAAVGGAILGAILGGKKGAILGGATGAAGGSAAVMAGDRNPATLPVGAVVTVRLSAPVTVEVEHR